MKLRKLIKDKLEARRLLVEEEVGKFERVMDSIADLVVIADPQGKITYVNQACTRLTGFPKEELLGKSLGWLRKRWRKHEKDFPAKLEGGSLGPFEIRWRTKSGSEAYFSVTASVIKSVDEEPLGTILILRDITERKALENALRDSEERLRLFVQNAPYPIFSCDLNGNLIDGNKEAERITGYSKRELLGKNLLEIGILPPEYAQKAKRLLTLVKAWELFRRSRTEVMDKPEVFEFFRKDGKKVTAELSAIALRTKRGAEVVCIMRDISEQRRVEEEFKLAFENAADAIFWADPQTGLIVNCNRAAEALLEKKKNEIIGRPQTSLHPPSKAEYYARMFKRHVKRGGAIVEEAEVITKSGKIKPVQISASVTLVGGKPIIQGTFRDLTEYKRVEEALLKSEAKAEAILNAIPDLMFRFSEEGVFLDYKGGARDLYLPPSKFLGKRVDQVLLPELARRTMEHLKRALRTKKVETFEYELPIKGELRYFEARLVASGKKEVLAIVREITDQKRMEQALKESEMKHKLEKENLQRICSSVPFGMVVENENFEVEFANKRMLKTFGPLVGKKCYKEFFGRREPCPVCPVKEILLGARRRTMKYKVVDKFGTPYQLIASQLKSPGKRSVVEVWMRG